MEIWLLIGGLLMVCAGLIGLVLMLVREANPVSRRVVKQWCSCREIMGDDPGCPVHNEGGPRDERSAFRAKDMTHFGMKH
jgi:hypothetical protein